MENKFVTFKEYVSNSRRLLLEMPFLDLNTTHSSMAAGASPIRSSIIKNHEGSSHQIGDSQYTMPHLGGNLYYRMHNGSPKELSYISGNIQVGVEKGEGGDVKHIHNFMRHHIMKFGTLKSSNSNTKGSRNMWVNFVKTNPTIKFHIHDTVTGDRKKVSGNNIDEVKGGLWGGSERHKNLILVAQR